MPTLRAVAYVGALTALCSPGRLARAFRQTLRSCLGKLARRCCWLKCSQRTRTSFFCRSAIATVRPLRQQLACDLPCCFGRPCQRHACRTETVVRMKRVPQVLMGAVTLQATSLSRSCVREAMRVASGPSPARQPSSTAFHATAARCSTGASALRLSMTLTARPALQPQRMPRKLPLAVLMSCAPLLPADPRMACAGRPFADANGGSSKQGSLQVLPPWCWPVRAVVVSRIRLILGTAQCGQHVTWQRHLPGTHVNDLLDTNLHRRHMG